MLLSVIVPIYNVERFLPRCLDSLLRQGMENVGGYEVICVDDASTDGCPAILADYAQRHPHLIRVITHQQNQGLGPARNTGMAAAQGEYIGFVDSDDYVIDGGFGYVCVHFLEKKPEVVRYESCALYQVEKDVGSVCPEGKIMYEGFGTEMYNRLLPTVVWLKMYKRSFIQENGIVFEPVLTEDNIFNLDVFCKNPYVIVTDCNIYRYMLDNSDSIMRTKSRERIINFLNGVVYGMGVYNAFLLNGEAKMRDGVRYKIENYLSDFYKRAFKICLTPKEWWQLTKGFRRLPIHTFSYKGSFFSKMVAVMKNLSGYSYLAYLIVRLIHRNIFERYIKQRIVGS